MDLAQWFTTPAAYQHLLGCFKKYRVQLLEQLNQDLIGIFKIQDLYFLSVDFGKLLSFSVCQLLHV